MLRWFTRLWRRDDGAFRFHDGVKSRKADPLALWREMERYGGAEWVSSLKTLFIDPSGLDPEELYRLHPARQLAVETLAVLTRKAFVIPSLDEGGLADAGVLQVMADFMAAVMEIEAEFRPFVIWSPPVSRFRYPATDEASSPSPSPTDSADSANPESERPE